MNTNIQKYLRWTAVIAAVMTVIILVWIKLVNPDFSLVLTMVIGIIAFALFGGMYFFYQLLALFNREDKKDEELPIRVNTEECIKLTKAMLLDPKYANEIESTNDDGPETHGSGLTKQSIFVLDIQAKYPDGGEKPRYVSLINQHYPDRRKLLKNPSERKIAKAKELITTQPGEQPDVEEIVTENALTGSKEYRKKTSRKRNLEKKQEEKGVSLEAA